MRGGSQSAPCSCHGGCDCGCCAGTEPLTPRTIANRPGLDALVYRVGTFSSFLETMKARLSSADHPALLALTTREVSDPAIAFLDTWAVVADVLTFYQERIANEGYLRTATERRSVLELARLVGYRLRPGVAASVHLAYTIEEKPKPAAAPGATATPASASLDEPEVVVPAGARAQSVPGPGELPQPFETSQDLVARAVWNRLQVRLTRPQQPEKILLAEDWPVGLDFQGTATQLRLNDPLLIQARSAEPDLYRVLAVQPEPVRDRTRAQVSPWLSTPSGSTPVTPVEPADVINPAVPPATAVAVEALVASASDLETPRLTPGATVRRVLSQLDSVQAAVAANAADSALKSQVGETLSNLRGELANAERLNASRLSPWLARVVADLEAVHAGLSPATAAALAGDEASAPASGTARIADVLGSLGRPTLVQPRNAQQLPRDVKTLFGPGSDLAAKLLTVAQPELAAGLYAAWANVPVTEPPALQVCALRTRASVFGHNAPLELVRDERGVITSSKEWDLFRELVAIQAIVKVGGDAGGPIFLSHTITLDAAGKVTDLEREIEERTSFHLSFPDEETVTITVKKATFGNPPLPMELEYVFSQYSLDIDVNTKTVKATVTGLDPATVKASVVNQVTTAIVSVSSSQATEDPRVVWLDAAYPQILPGSWIVLERPTPLSPQIAGSRLVIARVLAVSQQSRAAYGLTAKSTRVELDRAWLDLDRDTFAVIRGTAVYVQCEDVPLAEEPIPDRVCGGTLELAGLYDGLVPGRWLIVSGERADLTAENGVVVPGVPAAELVMLAGVAQGVAQWPPPPSGQDGPTGDLPGERTHTTLTLAQPLAYCYRRDNLTIFGNVVPATHGETKTELLGSGDGAKALQAFTLRQPPLTWISAPTTSGVASTLQVRVNDLLWHEAESFAALGPADRGYVTRTDDAGATTAVFGNGVRGARLPTGTANVRAKYRAGIGRPGNVKPGQISLLATRPLGVKGVVNPLAASGGADPESRDQARANAPLAVMSLDRLVSVQDYADFARTFAGVGKASAVRLANGRVQLVHVTIAGADDIPILESSDLFLNLGLALRRFGDPRQPVQLALRERLLLTLSAGVRVLPDYEWGTVEPRLRAALLGAFGYPRRDLGQAAFLSAVYQAIQGVRGVDFADVDVFDQIVGSVDPAVLAKQAHDLAHCQPKACVAARLARVEAGALRPAQLVYLSPEVPDTLILKELKS